MLGALVGGFKKGKEDMEDREAKAVAAGTAAGEAATARDKAQAATKASAGQAANTKATSLTAAPVAAKPAQGNADDGFLAKMRKFDFK